jgi:hypothetical protein
VAVNGTRIAQRHDKTITVDAGLFDTASVTPIFKFAVTAGDCIRVRRGGTFIHNHACTGGTTDAAGYGVNVTGGGRFFTTVEPTHTGGTPAKDLKTTNNGGLPNSTLSAAGTPAGVAADALLGEVLCRMSAAALLADEAEP